MRITGLGAVGFLGVCMRVCVFLCWCMYGSCVCVSLVCGTKMSWCVPRQTFGHVPLAIEDYNPSLFASSHWPTVLHSPWLMIHGATFIPSDRKLIPDISFGFQHFKCETKNVWSHSHSIWTLFFKLFWAQQNNNKLTLDDSSAGDGADTNFIFCCCSASCENGSCVVIQTQWRLLLLGFVFNCLRILRLKRPGSVCPLCFLFTATPPDIALNATPCGDPFLYAPVNYCQWSHVIVIF